MDWNAGIDGRKFILIVRMHGNIATDQKRSLEGWLYYVLRVLDVLSFILKHVFPYKTKT